MLTVFNVCVNDTWRAPSEVFGNLQGDWTLQRDYSDGSKVSGRAQFLRLPDGMLRYHEEGRVRLPDGREFNGFRDYIYGQSANGFTVFFVESPLRVFQDIVLTASEKGLAGAAVHLCAADTYDSRYTFAADGSFSIEHTVAGPRKAYVSKTVFTRLHDT